MDWAQILVVILSLFLAIFLLLGIVLVALLIKVTYQIKAVTESARHAAENIEHTVAGFGKIVSPVFLVKMILKQFNNTSSKKRKKEHGDDV